MAVQQYIGARYVPKFMGTYDPTQEYEALVVVDNGSGTSYVTRKTTPPGTPLTDTEYYALYGAASGAIIALQTQIDALDAEVSKIKGLVEYDTMVNAIADTAITDGMIIRTNGYYAEFDGGEAYYLVVNAVRTDAYCIALANGLYAALIDGYSDVNAKKCGLKPGTTTQAEADANADILNDLIDVIYTVHPLSLLTNGEYRGGGAIYIPGGNYRTNKTINGRANLVIYGDSKIMTRFDCFFGNYQLIDFLECTVTFGSVMMNLSVHDICISSYKTGIKLTGATGVDIYKCLFEGNDTAIHLTDWVSVNIRLCKVINGRIGFRCNAATSNCTSLYLNNNYIAHCSDYAISLSTAGTAFAFRTVYVLDSILEYCAYGIYANSGGSNAKFYVKNCHIEQNTTAAIAVNNAGVILKSNDIDTQITISAPNGQLVDLDNFDKTLSAPINNKQLLLKLYKNDGTITDTVKGLFRVKTRSTLLGSVPHLTATGAINYYRVTYSSSNGLYTGIIRWSVDTSCSIVSGTEVTTGIAAPVMNASGTVSFNADTGDNPTLTLEYTGLAQL